MNRIQDDRIFQVTRVVVAVIVPFLLLAFYILYFFPDQSGRRFAWEIKPNMTALFMGAGYLGGAWLFINAIISRHWHRVSVGFLPVSSFTITMLLATVLHWDRFDIGHFPFVFWLVLYVVTPFLIPWLWLRNQVTDPGTPEVNDAIVPVVARWSLAVLGVLLLIFTVVGFVAPDVLIALWPWTLTPLTARILAGWFSLLGVGSIIISRDSRWSAWRVALQSIGLWQLLIIIGALLNPGDFTTGLANWYLIAVVVVLTGLAVLYFMMEQVRRIDPTLSRRAGAEAGTVTE